MVGIKFTLNYLKDYISLHVLVREQESLILSASKGDLAEVQKLLSAGVSINAKQSYYNSILKYTPLQMAAMYGRKDVVKYFLEWKHPTNPFEKVTVNAKTDEKQTALYFAACFGRIDIAQMLFDNGADLNELDSLGIAALDLTIINEDKPMRNFLIKNNANIDAYSNGTDTISITRMQDLRYDMIETLKSHKVETKDKSTGRPKAWNYCKPTQKPAQPASTQPAQQQPVVQPTNP
ncbi:ankyrin repeats (many copies) domain-containing protein [Ditylenchus destructor]|uniref:Ankyrin repeats (Many copies) domain-containing protein n=1 Tax=Ditylenchus destructor TaxID=166010 RepID=A0AAD4QZ61_9BILA|nr:ankyrin repeats (many copies) domain-containing protein [Ditylenchus destructor]